jgi:hypothetical protein
MPTDIFFQRERDAAAIRLTGTPRNDAGGQMSASWIVVRIADQVIVGHYRTRREAAERAFQFSRTEPHVALRQLGLGWPGHIAVGGRLMPDNAARHAAR